MIQTLRDLLLQGAARLQERPALTVPDWGTLSHAQFRNRVEGVALGLLAGGSAAVVFSSTGTAWDWAAEVAAAASGLAWDPSGEPVPPEVLGGSRFNDQKGRGPYHDREREVLAATGFTAGLDHGEILTRLRRLNVSLGWDHASQVDLPLARLGEPPVRAALWSALFAGGHARLESPPLGPDRWRRPAPSWEPGPFLEFWGP